MCWAPCMMGYCVLAVNSVRYETFLSCSGWHGSLRHQVIGRQCFELSCIIFDDLVICVTKSPAAAVVLTTNVWKFCWGINWWPVNSTHKRPVTRKMFPFGDIIMHVNTSGAETGMFREKWVSIMAADVLAPFVTSSSTAMILIDSLG